MKQESKENKQNTYLMNPEDAAEMARLLLQDKMIGEATGGPTPELTETDLANMAQVLDAGCGPGGWALSFAKQNPHLSVTGVDISELMISYATVQAQREKIHNIRFATMNALERLPFPDNYFSMVNMRTAIAWIPRERWSSVLQEYYRVIRPGGSIRLGETDITLSNKPACEEWGSLLAHLIRLRGYGFSPDGETFGITPMLGKLLKDAGCQQIRYHVNLIDGSFGTPIHPILFDDGRRILKQIQPLLVSNNLARQEELNRLYEAFQEEAQSEDFRSVMYWLTASGQKPR